MRAYTNPNNILRQIQVALEHKDEVLAKFEAGELAKSIERGSEPDWARAYPSTIQFFFMKSFGGSK